jgi:predicted DNA-binding antitoxin AbrB/MazE fold protein
LEAELAQLERHYGLVSADFYHLYKAGELEQNRHFIQWVGYYEAKLEREARYRELQRNKEDVAMAKIIHAVYDHGILRPLETLDLKEAQRVKLTLEVLPSIVEETQALIRARADVVREVAEHDECLIGR